MRHPFSQSHLFASGIRHPHLKIRLPISNCNFSNSRNSPSPQTSHPYSITDLTRLIHTMFAIFTLMYPPETHGKGLYHVPFCLSQDPLSVRSPLESACQLNSQVLVLSDLSDPTLTQTPFYSSRRIPHTEHDRFSLGSNLHFA